METSMQENRLTAMDRAIMHDAMTAEARCMGRNAIYQPAAIAIAGCAALGLKPDEIPTPELDEAVSMAYQVIGAARP